MNAPKNLEFKVALLLEDIEKLNKYEAIRKVVQFVMEEIEWRKIEHQIDQYDLHEIRSDAIKEMTDYPINSIMKNGFEGDNHKLQALCYVEAVLKHFRGRGLIPFTVLFSRKGRK